MRLLDFEIGKDGKSLGWIFSCQVMTIAAIIIQNTAYWDTIVFREIYSMATGWGFLLGALICYLLSFIATIDGMTLVVLYSACFLFWTVIMLYGLRYYYYFDRFPIKRICLLLLPPVIYFDVVFHLYNR
ncbi:MAG: hypothetical protein NTX50_07600 [Candidatus Sumerlaeota bacterium]|nr:hypothetical protein [Candidatus Sumerlaeota bacterium]